MLLAIIFFLAVVLCSPLLCKHGFVIEILLVVHGTMMITDVITNLFCNDVPYQEGSAHAGILQSGQYLVNKYEPLFHKLEASNSP
jgi:hypothetical protein